MDSQPDLLYRRGANFDAQEDLFGERHIFALPRYLEKDRRININPLLKLVV